MAENVVEDRKQDTSGATSGTEKWTEGGDSQAAPEPKTITLTEDELRSRIDQAVTRALKTRTANLEKALREKEAQLAEALKKLEEVDPTASSKLGARELELAETQASLRAVREQLEAVLGEIDGLVAAEMEALGEADRKLVETMFPADTPALLKLKILRTLRNAGKFGTHEEKSGESTFGKVGTPLRPGQQGGEAGKGSREFAKLLELGKRLAAKRQIEEGIIPEAWQGR